MYSTEIHPIFPSLVLKEKLPIPTAYSFFFFGTLHYINRHTLDAARITDTQKNVSLP